MVRISETTKSVGLPLVGEPIEKHPVNHLLILMLIQSKTADFADERKEVAAKKKKAAMFMQSVSNELKRRGNFSLDTADDLNALISQITKQFGSEKLGVDEALMLSQMNEAFSKLNSLKSDMERLKKEIEELERDVNILKSNRSSYQKELDDYTSKYKNGGFIAPGYNAYLMAKILEYKGKRDDADKSIALKSSEIERVKKPELNALEADALRIQKSFIGSNEVNIKKTMEKANNELELLGALFDSAMSSKNFLNNGR